ncbi:MAG: glycosyltransferase [bacterium]|nr:glycosyltransferase [bacterium]
MKLLIITQKVDKNDPILGFFHRWLEELANKCESVIVICLERGEYDLPSNVKVLSLGKEEKNFQFSIFNFQKLKYVWRFYKYVWQERHNYDSVFVHMNQEYLLLAGDMWRVWGKRVFLWRNHAQGNLLTKLAGLLAHRVFYTSPKAFVASFSNAVIMPAGIDLKHFKTTPVPVESNRILVLGRISPVKRIDAIIDGLKHLELRGVDYKADIVGDALPKDVEYERSLKEKIQELGLARKLRMLPSVPHAKAPELYQQYKLLINLTPDGSLDKTIFEALASGLKVVVANSFFKDWLPTTWVLENPDDAKELAEKLSSALPDSHTHNSETQGKISVLLKEHSLKTLVDKLMAEFKKR